MHFDLLEVATRLAVFFVPFLFSLCFHEYAHGWVARLRGDRTAEMMGRLTLNPIAHIDMVGTIILPVMSILLNSPISFGWAKPVPVDSRNLKNPRTDMFWVALAGPLSNILLAFVGSFLLVGAVVFFGRSQYIDGIKNLTQAFIGVNLFLAFFNLIPIHPLDGGKVLARFLPASMNDKLEQTQHISGMILLFLILSGFLRFLVVPVEYVYNLMVHFALGFLS